MEYVERVKNLKIGQQFIYMNGRYEVKSRDEKEFKCMHVRNDGRLSDGYCKLGVNSQMKVLVVDNIRDSIF